MPSVSVIEVIPGRKYRLIGTVGAGKKRTRPQKTVECSKRELKAEVAAFLLEIEKSAGVNPVSLSVSQWIVRNAEDNRAEWSLRHHHTTLVYNKLYVAPTPFGKTMLSDITPALAKKWKNTLAERGGKDGGPLSPRTCLNAYRTVHNALDEAVRMEIIQRNPLDAVRPPKTQDAEPVVFSLGELVQIQDATEGTPLEIPVFLGLMFGLRLSEVCALQWKDFTLEGDVPMLTIRHSFEAVVDNKPQVRATKTGKVRQVRLTGQMVAFLKVHKELQRHRLMTEYGVRQRVDSMVCIGERYAHLNPHVLAHRFIDLLVSLGIRRPGLSFQALRRTNETVLSDMGYDRYQLGRRLGHSPRVGDKHYIGSQLATDIRMTESLLTLLEETRKSGRKVEVSENTDTDENRKETAI